MGEGKKAGRDVDRQRTEELQEEEEMKRISRLNPPTGYGRDEDRFANR